MNCFKSNLQFSPTGKLREMMWKMYFFFTTQNYCSAFHYSHKCQVAEMKHGHIFAFFERTQSPVEC